MTKENLLGQRFGAWTVIAETSRKPTAWECRCDCGTFSVVRAGHLKSGATQSCGCARLTQAGLSTSREYVIWARMIARCTDRWSPNFRFYGAIGIYVCQRWMGAFMAFREDMGESPGPEYTIDRIDTNKNYTCGKCEQCRRWDQPANCRWATKNEQARNQKSCRYYTHEGQTLILKDWARLTGIKYHTLWNRLNIGMAFADAISIGRYDRKRLMAARTASSGGAKSDSAS